MLPLIPQDKANHVVYGVAIALSLVLAQPTLPVWAPMALSGVIGALKEVYDRVSKRGTPDILDAVATVIGGAAVSLAIWAVLR